MTRLPAPNSAVRPPSVQILETAREQAITAVERQEPQVITKTCSRGSKPLRTRLRLLASRSILQERYVLVRSELRISAEMLTLWVSPAQTPRRLPLSRLSRPRRLTCCPS